MGEGPGSPQWLLYLSPRQEPTFLLFIEADDEALAYQLGQPVNLIEVGNARPANQFIHTHISKCLYCSFYCLGGRSNRAGYLLSHRSRIRIVAANIRPGALCCIWAETPIHGCDKSWGASSTSILPGLFSERIALTRP